MFISIRTRLLAIVLLLNALAAICYTYYLYDTRKEDLENQINGSLSFAARTVAQLADDNIYDQAQNGIVNKDTLRQLKLKAYNLIQKSDIKYIYTTIKKADGIFFVIDTPEKEEVDSGNSRIQLRSATPPKLGHLA